MIFRVYIEKKDRQQTSDKLVSEISGILGFKPEKAGKLLRYDIQGLTEDEFRRSYPIFCEAPVDSLSVEPQIPEGASAFVTEYQDGQFDQRADSAMQCIQLLLGGKRPVVRCATVYWFSGLNDERLSAVKKYLINPVDSKEGSFSFPQTLVSEHKTSEKMRKEVENFCDMEEKELLDFYNRGGFAMSAEDMKFVQNYFVSENRQPTETELRVIDTYWSDHCRHTTFLTKLNSIVIHSKNRDISLAKEEYETLFNELYAERKDKYHCLMDIATIAVKKLRREGLLDNLDQSEEINACSVSVKVDVDGKDEDWLIMFKNETHNHPTEIEPFGGAATCIGGAIRDPLSGRSYVYQAMRITGAGNPLADPSLTIHGKIPQRVLTKTALGGFSSYGNQIGLATGIVREVYNDRYVAKRLEAGYVIGGARKSDVIRERPAPGDVVIILGGDTGRDGCGGATGSSKSHTAESVEKSGAEVQKGNAPEERKIQRLFRNPEVSRMIIRCNDFGAGGVSVAIGELADGLDIRLEKVTKKYEGLTATELAISESQERMAVVVKPENVLKFKALAAEENIKANEVAVVTEERTLKMSYNGEIVCSLSRDFLDTNGIRQETDAVIEDYSDNFFAAEDFAMSGKEVVEKLGKILGELNVCSQKGLGEVFDSTIGNATVLMPFGGKRQLTPSMIMASKPPVGNAVTHTVTCSSYGIYTDLLEHSPFEGAIYSIVGAVSKLVASGVPLNSIRLSLQEFFKKLGKDPVRWGEPTAALLGAFKAQIGLGLGAIGGKDSMSGTYEHIDVPPTLIAFAMGVTRDDILIHNSFEKSGFVYKASVIRNQNGTPDFDALKTTYEKIYELIGKGVIVNAAVSEEGGALACVIKSLLGNRTGFEKNDVSSADFAPGYGDILFVTEKESEFDFASYYGKVGGDEVVLNGEKISFDALEKAFTETLESVFPTTAQSSLTYLKVPEKVDYSAKKPNYSVVKPRVFIPVFPGTNCEYDMAKAFERQGAECDVFVIRNLTASDIEYSVREISRRIGKAQIIAFPGGFSGGDEPDGSGKFIATTFSNPVISDSVRELLRKDGLILGICNGFQALIKLGLLPDGEISPLTEKSPTLTFNTIGRHVSTIARIKVAPNNSPWLSLCKENEIYSVSVSHGEGRLFCSEEKMDELVSTRRIATQYVDRNGAITMESPHNPNGSMNAVEGLLSPDGRVLGKMGHTERYESGLYKNVPGNFEMPIIEAGVKYFR